METVLLHKSAFLYVTSIFRLSSFVFANALLTGITKTFVPFYSSFPEIFNNSYQCLTVMLVSFTMPANVVKNANITVNSNTEATDITTNAPMLNIPQELTAWKVSETATKNKLEADNAKQCYLEIACKIRQSGAYLLGSASEYKTIYVPFGDTWEQGKRHIYTLIFGGGYDDQGEAVLNPIQFDAETTGWVDADKDVNVQP